MKIYPFKNGDAIATCRTVIEKVTKEIQSLENEYVLKASQAELENYYIEQVLISPLIL